MSTSGWCSAPIGARPQCERCRWGVCTCTCHVPESPVVEPDSPQNRVDYEATKRPLGGASTPLVQGASPTLIRSVD